MVETGGRGAKTIFCVVDTIELRYSAVVKEVLTYVWCFDEERNTMLLKFVGGTNAREHKELRGSERAATDENLFIGLEDLARGQFDARSSYRAPRAVLENDAFDGGIGQDFNVFKSICFPSGLPFAVVPILDVGCHAFIVSAVVVSYRLYANLQVCFFQLFCKRIRAAEGWGRVYGAIEAMLMGIGLWVMVVLSFTEIGE